MIKIGHFYPEQFEKYYQERWGDWPKYLRKPDIASEQIVYAAITYKMWPGFLKLIPNYTQYQIDVYKI